MANIGIICEYNPFHNGHLYHIYKIKEMFKIRELVDALGYFWKEKSFKKNTYCPNYY